MRNKTSPDNSTPDVFSGIKVLKYNHATVYFQFNYTTLALFRHTQILQSVIRRVVIHVPFF